MRISTRRELPTVSIQKGLAICSLISSLRMPSRMLKKGRGAGLGRGSGGSTAMLRLSFSRAMRVIASRSWSRNVSEVGDSR